MLPDAGVASAVSAAVPDSMVSTTAAASADPVQVALPADSSKRSAYGGKKKKRKMNRTKTAAAAKTKKSKATSKRDLPQGVEKTSSGKFKAKIWWCGWPLCW